MTRPTFRPQIGDIKTAFALLTRLPVNARFDRSAQAIWAAPIVGAVVGIIALATTLVCGWFGLGQGISVGLAMVSSVIITGAMHEDGIADSADGLWGGWTKERRLEIMRDSHIGTYGVLALIIVMLFRFSALGALLNNLHLGAFVAAAILSRAALPYVMTLLPHARADGLSVQTGRPSRQTASFGALIAIVPCLFLVGFTATVITSCVLILVVAGVIKIANAKVGGQTGDILGATQVLSELAALACFVAVL
jgi:adenosylcobinamide-GDP ribazoletransferase